MNPLQGFLFHVYPYDSFKFFIVGSLILFDTTHYRWKIDSSQMLRSCLMRWGSNLFNI